MAEKRFKKKEENNLSTCLWMSCVMLTLSIVAIRMQHARLHAGTQERTRAHTQCSYHLDSIVCVVFGSVFAPLNSIRSKILTLDRCMMLLFTKRQHRNGLIWNVWKYLQEIIASPSYFLLFNLFLYFDFFSKSTETYAEHYSYSSLQWLALDNFWKWLEWSQINYKAASIVLHHALLLKISGL